MSKTDKNTDKRIIEAILSNDDRESEEVLYSDIFPYIRKLVVDYNYSEEDAKDIFQDCVLLLICKIREGLVLTCSLTTLMYSMAKNLIKVRKRDEKKQHQAIECLNLSDSYNPENERNEKMMCELREKILHDSMSKMKEEQCKVMMQNDSETRRSRWQYKQRLKGIVSGDPRFDDLND